MFYITGDTHGSFQRIIDFVIKFNLTKDDVLIILGDVGLNFYNNKTDEKNKKILSKLPNTFFCLHGNHEIRPENISSYKTKEYKGGIVYYEEEYPNILFAKDGEIFDFEINNEIKKVAVCGGAYSIDKYYRILRYITYREIPEMSINEKNLFYDFCNKTTSKCNIEKDELEKINNILDKLIDFETSNKCSWWKDEQISEENKKNFIQNLTDLNWNIDIVLSHTTPLKYEPVEWFLSNLNQSSVDKSMEEFLDTIENKLNYNKWYCGHYHGSKKIDKIQFMFNDFDELK